MYKNRVEIYIAEACYKVATIAFWYLRQLDAPFYSGPSRA